MVRRLLIVVAVIVLSVGTVSTQEVDARAALQAALEVMGGEDLRTIEYSGDGHSALIGQQYSVNGGWSQ